MQGRKAIVKPLGDVIDLPISSVRIPDCPEGMSPREQAIWRKTAAVLVAKNTYDVDCEDTLEAYCVHRARWKEAEAIVKNKGLFQKKATGDGRMVASAVTVANEAHRQVIRLAAELGLTPASRNKVSKARGAKKSAKLDDIA